MAKSFMCTASIHSFDMMVLLSNFSFLFLQKKSQENCKHLHFLDMKRRYKDLLTFDERCTESARVMRKYPDRIPIICERALFAKPECPYIDKCKYLVPRELTVGQLMYVIRKRLKLQAHQALYLFAGTMLPCNVMRIDALHQLQKDDDQFLYITYSLENTFG